MVLLVQCPCTPLSLVLSCSDLLSVIVLYSTSFCHVMSCSDLFIVIVLYRRSWHVIIFSVSLYSFWCHFLSCSVVFSSVQCHSTLWIRVQSCSVMLLSVLCLFCVTVLFLNVIEWRSKGQNKIERRTTGQNANIGQKDRILSNDVQIAQKYRFLSNKVQKIRITFN